MANHENGSKVRILHAIPTGKIDFSGRQARDIYHFIEKDAIEEEKQLDQLTRPSGAEDEQAIQQQQNVKSLRDRINDVVVLIRNGGTKQIEILPEQ